MHESFQHADARNQSSYRYTVLPYHLQNAEYDVVVIDNLVNSSRKSLDRVEKITGKKAVFYEADINDASALNEIFDKESIDCVIHFAGLKAVGESVAKPLEYYMNNISGSLTLFDVMRKHDNVCKYLDIALQHISDHMLSAMHRNTTKKETYELVERMRKEVPGITLRTTLMVGFPGETDEDFKELVEFVKWARFERMGAFTYSEEEGTYSASHYEDDVPEDVKQERLGKLMRVQERISAEIEVSFIGKKAKVIIDRLEGDYYIGRTQSSSPEVDPEVLIPSSAENPLVVGEFYEVEITGAEEFDVYAKIIDA